MDGAGPNPTGRRMPPLGLADRNVVAWKLVAGRARAGAGAAWLCSSAAAAVAVVDFSGADGLVGELEKQLYSFLEESSYFNLGGPNDLPLRILCCARVGSIAGFGTSCGTLIAAADLAAERDAAA